MKHTYTLTLMDHHDLDKSQKFLCNYVVGIIDHHSFEIKNASSSETKKIVKNEEKVDKNKEEKISNDDKPKEEEVIKEKKEKKVVYVENINSDQIKIIEETYPNLKDRENLRISFPRASNMAIVIEKAIENETIRKFFEEKLENKNNYIDFLIGVIVVDSANFKHDDEGLKWIHKDKEIFETIFNMSRQSLFINYEVKLEEVQELMKKNLYNIKFNEEKNMKLGTVALIDKDRKDFEIKINKTELKLIVSFHSIPINVLKLLNMEKNHEITGPKVRDYLYKTGEEESLDCSVLLFREKLPQKDDKGRDIFISYAAFYLKKTDIIKEQNLHEFLKHYKLEIEKKQKKDKNNKIEIGKEDFLYYIKSDFSINRKHLLPIFQSFYQNLKLQN